MEFLGVELLFGTSKDKVNKWKIPVAGVGEGGSEKYVLNPPVCVFFLE